MKNNVLVVAVHPDDETLGCGGTLLKHKANNDNINWLICTTLNKTHKYYQQREAEIKQVASMYQFDHIYKLDLLTTKVHNYDISNIIEQISNILNQLKPNILYIPFKNDVHSDHRIIFEAIYSCTKSFRYPFIQKILMMEVVSESEFADITNSFIPNVFVDVSDYFDKKIEILKFYQSEIKEFPFPRSIKNITSLANFRGASCGCDKAESFMLLKEIIK